MSLLVSMCVNIYHRFDKLLSNIVSLISLVLNNFCLDRNKSASYAFHKDNTFPEFI